MLFVLFQMFIVHFSKFFKGFLMIEIRKNLNVLVTPKIFLKSRLHCIVFFIFKTMEYFSVSHQWLVRTYIVPYTAKDCFYPISSPLSCHNLACQKGMKQQEQRHSNMRLHPSNLRGGTYVRPTTMLTV